MAGEEKENEVYFPATDCFREALNKRLDEEGHGAQARLAKAIERGTKHLNDIVQGRRPASLDFQERVARFLKVPLDRMLAEGRELLKEKAKPFPYAEVAKKIKTPEKRAEFICEKAVEDLELGESPLLPSQPIVREVARKALGDQWEEYISGAMEDEDLFVQTQDKIMQAIEELSKKIPSRKKRKRP